MVGVLVLVGTLVFAGVVGLVLRSRSGRVSTRAVSTLPAAVTDLLDPADSITLVQLTTTFCAPCRQARVLLADLAARTDGVRHVEVDLTDRPELAKALAVLRTPTTLAVDAGGTELLRVGGVPRADELLDALRPHLTPAA